MNRTVFSPTLILFLAAGWAHSQPVTESDLIPAGSINSAVSKPPIVLVVQDEPAIMRYANAIASRFFKTAKIVKAKDAVKADFKGSNLIVYGTPKGNAWIQKYAKRLPFRYAKDAVWLHQKYVGKKLRVICAIRNPQDPSRRAVLYTAARSKDLLDINNLFHGPTEWVVAEGRRVLASGNYQVTGKLSPKQLRRDLDYLVEKIEIDHPATVDGLPEDLKSAVSDAKKRIRRPLKRTDFWFVLNGILVALNDAHSSLNPLRSGELIDLPIQWLQEGLIVTRDTASLKKGDRIHSIGKHSEAKLLEKLEGLIPAENSWWVKNRGETALQDLAILHALGAVEGTAAKIVVERAGKRKTLSITAGRGRRSKQAALSWVRYALDKERSLGVFTLDRCVNDEHYRKTVREFFQAVQKEKLDRIAVDVRQNGGGNSRVIDEFLRYIDVANYYSYSSEVRVTADSLAQRWGIGLIGYKRHGRNRRINQKQEGIPTFAGKVYVLTSRRTFSSGNWFAAIFQDNGIGEVIGEPTGNAPSSYGDVLRFTLPESGFSFTLSFKKWTRPDPGRDPANTVEPDLLIPLTRQDLIDGVDPVLDYLRGKKRARSWDE